MEVEPIDNRRSIKPLDESSLDLNTSFARILHLIEGSPKVVDFGCGEGELARFLTQRGCTVFGVDIDADAAGLAREFCADVLIADLDSASPLKLFPTERFDVAIFAGILGHLRKPEQLLAGTSRILRSGGCVIASILNTGHGAIRLSLFKGEMKGGEPATLRGATRFFNRDSIEALFQDAGFVIDEIGRTTAPVFGGDKLLLPALDRTQFSDSVVAEIEADPEAQTLEFIVKALPAASSAARNIENQRTVQSLTQRVSELEGQLVAAKAELAEKIDFPTREHLEEVQRQLHIALLGPEGVEALRAQLQQTSAELAQTREQMTALSAREESTARREAKLAKENLEALESIGRLQDTINEREATIATLQADLDASEAAIRQRIDQLASASEREQQLAQKYAAAQSALTELHEKLEREEASVRDLQQQLESANRLLEDRFRQISGGRADLGHAREELAGERQRLRRLEQKSASRQEELAAAKITIQQQRVSISMMEAELEAGKDDATGLLAQLRRAETLCESGEANRTELTAEIESLRGQLHRSKQSNSAALQEIEAMQAELDSQQRARDKIESAWRDAEQQYAAVLHALDAAERRANRLMSEVTSSSEKYKALKRANDASEEQSEAILKELDVQIRTREQLESLLRDAKREHARSLSQLSELSARLERDEFYLEQMRRSKFWRVRNGWFTIKRAFGVTTDIP